MINVVCGFCWVLWWGLWFEVFGGFLGLGLWGLGGVFFALVLLSSSEYSDNFVEKEKTSRRRPVR